MDELLHLREEFGLADAAAAAFQVESRAESLALRIMVADTDADVADFVDGAEIERAAPDEGLDFGEEAFAESLVAGRGARANESGPLPRQSLRFIIRDRRRDRKGD